jgi:hypothetical protein
MSPDFILMTADLIRTTERKSLLEQLKVLGRDPANSESIFAKKVVSTGALR